ncbi:aminopeptidase N [Engraulis encrasicolus]|uniref:aminopeptidase N n=1 Tax=Engraulis encrasicolus TaxID=184585 RepID=UPI002FD08C28
MGEHMARLTAVSGTAPLIRKTWLHEPMQYLVVQLNGALRAGQDYDLYTEFQGQLLDDLEGLYRSEYYEDGVKKVVATSQMHPTHARKTFPCFDEPAIKAIINLTVLHKRGTVALSNGKELATEDILVDGHTVTRTTFEPTPKMSTYLLALVVSDYHYVTQNGTTEIRIWARKSAIFAGHGDYALEVTGPVLKFFEKYYDIPYPLSKSDQIALPDFYFGAMENWGLVTYREANLLYDPDVSSNRNKETTATIIAHELAHMWFGNLVTLKWWNEVWLNEGFATYVSYLGAHDAEPNWNVKDLIVLDEMHRVFAVDALASSRPLSFDEDDVYKPEQITELFDVISYSKGASILRMLSDFLTEPVFLQGLKTYLNAFEYSNTESRDLWDHLEAAVKTTETSLPTRVHDIMYRWVLQMGFPVVSIDTATGTVSQQHFLLDPNAVPERPSHFNYQWIIPIRWKKSGGSSTLSWLLEKHVVDSVMKTSGEEWLLANINVTGYYRVNYDAANWDRLLVQLKDDHQVIPVINRAQLVDDAFNLARAKLIPMSLALNTTTYLTQERDYMPWESTLNNLDYIILMFEGTRTYDIMQRYLKQQVEPLYAYFKKITADWSKVPDGHTEQYNQVNALEVACSTGVDDCQNVTSGWYSQWMAQPNNNTIHPNLRATVYCSAIRSGGVKEWDFGWTMFKSATIAIEANKLMAALACTHNTTLLKRYLNYTLQPDEIRKQDATTVIVSVAGNVNGQDEAWNFVKENWGYMFTEYGVGSFSFGNLISGVTASFSTQEDLNELVEFQERYADIGFGSGTPALMQAFERTQANIKWVAENQGEIEEWLIQHTS